MRGSRLPRWRRRQWPKLYAPNEPLQPTGAALPVSREVQFVQAARLLSFVFDGE
jgi:hypothetical protein